MVVAAALALGCSGEGSADAGTDRDDAGTSLDAMTEVSPDGGTPALVPTLLDVCLDGWCFEQPAPLAAIDQLLRAGDRDLYLSVRWGATQRLLRFDGEEIGEVELPEPLESSLPMATAADDVWFWRYRDDRILHFDGAAWSLIDPPTDLSSVQTFGRGRLWATSASTTAIHYEWNGSMWIRHELAIAGASWVQPVASQDGSMVLLAVSYGDSATGAFMEWTGELVVDSPIPYRSNLSFVRDRNDLWAGLSHWNGTEWTDSSSSIDATVIGGPPDDVWAVGPGTAYRFDGSRWTQTDTAAFGRFEDVTPDSRSAWALDDGRLLYFDGGSWQNVGSRGPTSWIGDIEAVPSPSGPRVWAVADDETTESFVLERDEDATWTAIEATRSRERALQRISARHPSDVWAYGREVLHFDGSSWTDRSVGVEVLALCASDDGLAYALGEADVGGSHCSPGTAAPGNAGAACRDSSLPEHVVCPAASGSSRSQESHPSQAARGTARSRVTSTKSAISSGPPTTASSARRARASLPSTVQSGPWIRWRLSLRAPRRGWSSRPSAAPAHGTSHWRSPSESCPRQIVAFSSTMMVSASTVG
jgi:hypothetical protein